ncbi:DnaK suppressor protein [Streptomyces sp. V3I8]|uniref:TraR/DksA family transcriptional regulator n=1 Tax=Streptomyces sp. V3I8 TaxID=3042279 RepID=UPI0027834284|nr:DnaK suppressor protein [Streptomyces sp. V3I8]
MNDQIIDDHGTRTPAEDRGLPLSAVELAALRADLHEQRLFRQEQLRQLSAAAAATTRADALPDRRATAQIEVRVQLAASARMVLADVEDALTRMDRGRYGTCHLCHEPLTRERLLIVPQARHCTRCQQDREAGR